jgi:hypothetical protein
MMSHADQPIQPRREKPARVWLAEGQNVSLGCGTLILIAIIVAIFSNRNSVDLAPVTSRLEVMDQKLQHLEQQLQKLDQKLERQDKKVNP